MRSMLPAAALFAILMTVPPALAGHPSYGYNDGLSVYFESSTWDSGDPLTTLYCIGVDVLNMVDGAGNHLNEGELYNHVTWGDGTSDEFPWYSDTNYAEPWASPDYGMCNGFAFSLVPYVITLTITDPWGREVSYQDTWPSAPGTDLTATCVTVADPLYRYVGYRVLNWGDLVLWTCQNVVDEYVDAGDPVCEVSPTVYWSGDCHWAMTDPGSWGGAVGGHVTSNGVRLANDAVTLGRGTANAWLRIFGLGPV